MGRKTKMAVILLIDSAIIVFANLASNIFLASMMTVSRRHMVYALLAQVALYVVFGFLFGVFNRITRYTSINSIVSIFSAITVASAIELVFFYALDTRKEDLFRKREVIEYMPNKASLCHNMTSGSLFYRHVA